MANQGIINSANNLVVNPADRQQLANTAAPFGVNLNQFKAGISTLTKFETKCLLVQLGNLESNSNSSLVSIGVPNLGIYRGTINANTLISNANIATVTITNSDNSDIKLGMIAQTTTSTVGTFGSNTMVVATSSAANVIAGNFIPGCTYTITSLGTTDFKTIGHDGNVTVVGNVFVANAIGSGTGTAIGRSNEIVLGSNHTVGGAVTFNVSPLKLGKYQASQWFLTKYGYLSNSGAWIGKDGIDTNEVFLAATEVQNRLVQDFVQEQYVELIRSGAIRNGDSKETVAGMLALAYQYQDLGNPQLKQNVFNTNGTINLENYSIATKANVWRETGQTVDSQGRPGHIYFNGGRYAIRNLGADVPE
jgi:hypothetical protein